MPRLDRRADRFDQQIDRQPLDARHRGDRLSRRMCLRAQTAAKSGRRPSGGSRPPAGATNRIAAVAAAAFAETGPRASMKLPKSAMMSHTICRSTDHNADSERALPLRIRLLHHNHAHASEDLSWAVSFHVGGRADPASRSLPSGKDRCNSRCGASGPGRGGLAICSTRARTASVKRFRKCAKGPCRRDAQPLRLGRAARADRESPPGPLLVGPRGLPRGCRTMCSATAARRRTPRLDERRTARESRRARRRRRKKIERRFRNKGAARRSCWWHFRPAQGEKRSVGR